ncbi:MAG TPA: hypothetical protein PLY02_01155 [Candidatus Pacearchaeota archaeon]|nr:hypothetical protein [Candidatus Pacearchaeota archaeon]HOK94131.1 hypothetical protein [Candidatus Pacearchaeota archaeon]
MKRIIKKIGEIDLIRSLSVLNKEDIKVIFSAILPMMPKECYWIDGEKISLPLMEMIGELLIEGKFEEIIESPSKICERCKCQCQNLTAVDANKK